jgi:hypothetical protein
LTFAADADLFDHAIAKMIEYERDSGSDNEGDEDEGAEGEDLGDEENADGHGSETSEKAYDRSFPNLKAIYVGASDMIHNTPPRRQRWFAKAIAAGGKFGIDVHTRTTRAQSFHDTDFPKPPAFKEHRPTSLPAENPPVFDVYSGRWTRSMCGNCGKCDGCLEQYDVSVWKAVEDEFERESC